MDESLTFASLTVGEVAVRITTSDDGKWTVRDAKDSRNLRYQRVNGEEIKALPEEIFPAAGSDLPGQ